MNVTKQQLVDALTFCANGYRFPRFCHNCVLTPFCPSDDRDTYTCATCINNMLLAALEFIDECETNHDCV